MSDDPDGGDDGDGHRAGEEGTDEGWPAPPTAAGDDEGVGDGPPAPGDDTGDGGDGTVPPGDDAAGDAGSHGGDGPGAGDGAGAGTGGGDGDASLPATDGPAGDDGREGPLSDVAERIEGGGVGDAPTGEFTDEVDVEVDREALWKQVAGEDAAEVAVGEADEADADVGAAGGTGAAPEGGSGVDHGEPTVRRPGGEVGATGGEGRYERVVEKSKYCEQCEFFSAPPEVHCNHEGTEIAEMVDSERFRLIDCPIVREDEELERV